MCPHSVTENDPGGKLGGDRIATVVMTGPSKVNSRLDVPTLVETVSVDSVWSRCPSAAKRQSNEVADVHAAVQRGAEPTAIVGVKLYTPKFSPLIVIDRLPES